MIHRCSIWSDFMINKIELFTNVNAEFELNKNAFIDFIDTNFNNPDYRDKYIVFVHGDLYAIGDTEIELVQQVYKNFGNIVMYVGKVSQNIPIERIESPICVDW